MRTLDKRLAMIAKIISDESFIKNKGLSNEAGYYILIIRHGWSEGEKTFKKTIRSKQSRVTGI